MTLYPQGPFAANIYDGGGAAFNPVHPTFGATFDGVTDDTVAIQAAIDAADAAGDGLVTLPHGIAGISDTITIPAYVSLVGVGATQLKAISAISGPMISVTGAAGFGNRLGKVGNLQLNGNGLATHGLYVGSGSVQRVYENMYVYDCLNVGVSVVSAQNNLFLAINSEKNGSGNAFDCNMLIDLGAGNNLFSRCELTASSPEVASECEYNLIVRQSAAGGPFTVPTSNTFLGCVVERYATASLGSIYHRAGRKNVFLDCDIQTGGARTAVVVDELDGFSSSQLRFSHCSFAGTLASSTAFSLIGIPSLIIDICLFENFAVGFSMDDDSYVELVEPCEVGSVTLLVSPTGAKLASALIGTRLKNYAGTPTGVPAGITGTNPILYDSTNNMLWVYNGAWRYTPLALTARATYTATNVSTDRSFDADTVAVAELADVVGTLIADLRAQGHVL